jgi:hypothetical protein
MRQEMMQARLAINAVVLVLTAGVSVQTATACSKEAVAGAVDRWTTVLAENNPDTIVALYSKDAVLWGTLSSTVRSDPAGLKAYFVGAFQALPKLTVKFGEQFIRVYGDTAVNTGYYTLFYTKDGETKSIPARYSFTFVKEGNDCKICMRCSIPSSSRRDGCATPTMLEYLRAMLATQAGDEAKVIAGSAEIAALPAPAELNQPQRRPRRRNVPSPSST